MAANERSVLYEGAFGRRSMASEERMSTDTIFRIASMVKLLTSVAALQLVEQGRLRLDEPAADIDPSLASAEVLAGFGANDVPQLRLAQKPITLRQLLSRTSGFSYLVWDPNVARYLKVARHDPHLPRKPLMFEPGTRWAYGSSLDNVGKMVEIASGQDLDRYFCDHITGPPGMNDTAFSLNEQQRAREASLHVRDTHGKLLPQPPERHTSPAMFSGGGGIYSTAPDYLTLLQVLLNGGSLRATRLLRPETVALISNREVIHPAAQYRVDQLDHPVYDTLKLFNGYRVKRLQPKVTVLVAKSASSRFPLSAIEWCKGRSSLSWTPTRSATCRRGSSFQRRQFLPGQAPALRARPQDQSRSGHERPQGRQPHLGRVVQYPLLDRSLDADRGCDHDADPPLRRRSGACGLSAIRAWSLPRVQAGLRRECWSNCRPRLALSIS
jgi:CubicO group peptidase (beta-lactamase class C family)